MVEKASFKYISYSGYNVWCYGGQLCVMSAFTLSAAGIRPTGMSRNGKEGVLCEVDVKGLASTWGPSATVHPGIINSTKHHTSIVPR